MRKFLILLLVFAMSISIIACGKTPEPTTAADQTTTTTTTQDVTISTAEAGEDKGEYPQTYMLTEMEYEGIKMEGTGEWIRLDSADRGTFYMTGKEYPFSYEIKDGRFIMNQDVGVTQEGDMTEGKIVLNSTAMIQTYILSDGAPVVSTSETTEELTEETTVAEMSSDWVWEGDWYGWWLVHNASEYYDELDYIWWDAFARITKQADNTYQITIWDEDSSADEPMSDVVFSVQPYNADTSAGVASSTSGYFFLMDLGPDDWNFGPRDADFVNMLVINAHYETEDGSYDYQLVLRPWGQRWDDVRGYDPDDVPFYYDSYYLPLIDANEPMPDVPALDVSNESEVTSE